MAGFNLKQFRDIYASVKAYIIAHQSRVSDFNAGSVIASEIEAFAREMALMYSETRAGLSEVLKKMPATIFGLSRNEAQKAIGAVTFARVSTTGAVTIPAGTQIATPGNVIFETTEEGTMADGSGSVTVDVQAIGVGISGNVPAGTVTIIVSGLSGVDSVLNYSSIGGGVDEETDSEFLNRFRSYLLGLARSNKWGLISGALLNPALRSVSIVEHFPPRLGLYNLTMYLDDGAGTVSPTTIAAVKEVIDGDGTASLPGYRAAGINADYQAPSIVSVDVSGTVYISYEVSSEEAKATVDAAITEFVNGHIIGEDVIRAQLMKAILKYSWVVDIEITNPEGNIAISDGQIARAGTINITYTQTAG